MDKPDNKVSPPKKTTEPHHTKTYRSLPQGRISYIVYQLFTIARGKHNFSTMIIALILTAALITPYPSLARWFAFMVASYSAIANDSIQTLGTLIASHGDKKWWYLWLYIGSIFVATILYSWFTYQGDVSYQLLNEKGLAEAPTTFSFLQLFSPIVLLILTRWRIPVSTSFLLLNVFTTEVGTVLHVLQKSFYGYFIAFITSFLCWSITQRIYQRYHSNSPWKGWITLQWIASGGLWSAWIMQDTSNIAVFLPRHLNWMELLGFISFIFFGLGVLFALRGDKMQKVVMEKSGLTNVRAATFLNIVYMIMLIYFKTLNNVPMSTTWVFIGLLAGRELAITLAGKVAATKKKSLQHTFYLLQSDLKNALLGLLISISLAILANPAIREALLQFFKN